MLIKNIAINITAQGYLFLLSFFTTPFILNRLKNEKYGILAIITAVIAQFAVLDLGIGTALTQKIASLKSSSKNKIYPYLKTAFIFYLLLALLIGSCFFLLSPFLSQKIFHLSLASNILFYITAINLALYFLTAYTDSVFQGWERFYLYNLKTIIVGTANTLGAAIILSLGYGLKEILFLQTGSLLLTLALSFFFLSAFLKIDPLKGRFSYLHLKKMLSFGIFKSWGNLSEQINLQFPKFLIASLAGVNQVPLFTIPLSLVQKTGIALSQIYLSLFPNISHLKGKRKIEKIKRIFMKGEFLVFLLMLPLLIAGLIWGEDFLNWWLKDPQFAHQAAPILSLLVVAYFLRALSVIPVATVEGLGNSKLPAFFVTLKMLITIGLGPFLILKYAAQGSAWLVLGLTIFTVPSFLLASYRFLDKQLASPKKDTEGIEKYV
jgi:O-antigen/teichoic acid export membrane protein